MALITADFGEKDFALRRIPGWRDAVRLSPRHYHRCKQKERSPFHAIHRGCVTTSIKAGSPRFTTSIADLIAGPKSLGLSIGPALYMP